MKRLRIFDWNTPWFWIVIFAQRVYAEPRFSISVYDPAGWSKWWFHFWAWEQIHVEAGAYAVSSSTPEPIEGQPGGQP